MKQICIGLTVLAVAMLGDLGLLNGPPGGEEPAPEPVIEKVVINDTLFRLELAVDEEARAKGLSGRDHIDDDGGMLFVYPNARERSFWMVDCLVDMDLLYLDSRGRIVSTHKLKAEQPRGKNEPRWRYEARLKRYVSRRPAQYVIELKAGTIEKLQIEPNQVIELDRKRLTAMARD